MTFFERCYRPVYSVCLGKTSYLGLLGKLLYLLVVMYVGVGVPAMAQPPVADDWSFPVMGVEQSDLHVDPLDHGWAGSGLGTYGNFCGHFGQDYFYPGGGTQGAPVYAAAAGVVFEVVDNDVTTYGWCDAISHGWGRVVVIRHEADTGSAFNTTSAIHTLNYSTDDLRAGSTEETPTVVYTLYGHLGNDIPVLVGDTVARGEPIGVVGTTAETGYSTPHLHFEIKTQMAVDTGVWMGGACTLSYTTANQSCGVQGVGGGYSHLDNYAPDHYIPSEFIPGNQQPLTVGEGSRNPSLFLDAFDRIGGVGSGWNPVSYVFTEGIGEIQLFLAGDGTQAIISLADGATTAYATYGGIYNKYKRLGRGLSFLGYPATDEEDTYDSPYPPGVGTTGRYVAFWNGSESSTINHNNTTGATCEIHGDNFTFFQAAGYSSWHGFPIKDVYHDDDLGGDVTLVEEGGYILTEDGGGTIFYSPTAPKNLRIEYLSDDRLTLRWDDGSQIETNYRLVKNTWFPKEKTLKTEEFILPANSVFYEDTDILPGTAYSYQIVGQYNSSESPLSNLVVANYTGGYYPFVDDMENPGSGNWVADIPWTLIQTDYHSFSRCWTDSPTGYYASNSNVVLETSFTLDLGTSSTPVLHFWHHYDLEPGYDFGYVEVSTDLGFNWTPVAQYSGTETEPATKNERDEPKLSQEPVIADIYGDKSLYPNWVQEQIDLSTYTGEPSVQIRFRLESDGTVNRDGWYLDDISVAEQPTAVTLASLSGITPSSIDLSWTASSDPDFSRYEIYREVGNDTDFNDTLVATIHEAGTIHFTDSGLAAKTDYAYRVYTVSGYGVTATSNVQTGTTLDGLDYPFADDVESGVLWYASIPGTWRRVTPDVAHSGNKIWTDSAGSDYGNNVDTSLELAGTLPLTESSTLVFWHRLDIASGDSALVEISTNNGISWTRFASYTGATESDWTRIQIDISTVQAAAAIRFRMKTDGSGTAAGWDLDDITVSDAPEPLVLQDPVTSPGFGQLLPTWDHTTNTFFQEYQLYRDTSPAVDTSSPLVFSNTNPIVTSYLDEYLNQSTAYYYRIYEVSSYGVEVASNVASGTPSGEDYPFFDDMEVANTSWTATTPWARTTEDAYSNSYCWTDSPGVPYSANVSASLSLDLSLLNSVRPYVTFWHRFSLGLSTELSVEYSSNGSTWYKLAAWDGFCSEWREERIDLSEYTFLDNFQLRFRINGRGTPGEGWYIDDVLVGENTTPGLAYPFHDGVEDSVTSANLWLPGSWEQKSPGLSGGHAWAGHATMYRDNISMYGSLASAGFIDLAGAANPQLVFWHYREIGGYGNFPYIYVQVQVPGGNWTTIYFRSSSAPTNWTREQVDLSTYTGSQVRLRFRTYTDGATSYDYYGTWYVDEISVADPAADVTLQMPSDVGKHQMSLIWSQCNEPDFVRYEIRRRMGGEVTTADPIIAEIPGIATTSFTDSSLELNQTYHYKVYVVRTEGSSEVTSLGSNDVLAKTLAAPFPLIENVEGSLENWDLGNPWSTTAATVHGGSLSFTDSPEGPYGSDVDASLSTALSLYASGRPYLTFWHRYSLGDKTQISVEYHLEGSSWQKLAVWEGFEPNWRLVRIDLSDYQGLDDVWLRFHIKGNDTSGEGWYLDDIQIEENSTSDFVYPFYEGFEDSVTAATVTWLCAAWGEGQPGWAGDACWSGWSGVYRDNMNLYHSLVTAGWIDLTGAENPQLVFWLYRELGGLSNYPYLYLTVRAPGGEWTSLRTWSSSGPTEWTRVQVDLSAYAGAKAQLRFWSSVYGDDNEFRHGTWYLDEVTVTDPAFDVTLDLPFNVGKHEMSLSWTQSVESDFVRYEIRRRLDGAPSIDDPVIASIPNIATTSFMDTGLELNRVYHYKVYVVRQEDTNEVVSLGSNDSFATTLQAPFPLAEDVEGSTENWDFDSPWGITDTVMHGGSYSFNDNPGLPYLADVDASLHTSLSLDTALSPYLTFWHQYSLGSLSRVEVEYSLDAGSWSKLAAWTGYEPEWRRVSIDLSEYAGENNFWLRFRIQGDGTAGEGWYIDDVHVIENSAGVNAYPFYEGFEDSVAAAETWFCSAWREGQPGLLGEACWAGRSQIYHDNQLMNHSLTTAGWIDLTSAVNPQLAFWLYRQIEGTAYYPYLYVEVQTLGGDWTNLISWSSSAPTAWAHQQTDLSAYVGTEIRLRFHSHISGHTSYNYAGTWYLDEVSIAEESAAPGMMIQPDALYFNLHPGEQQAHDLTIDNPGTSSLSYVISEAGGAGSSKLDLEWLTVSPQSGLVTPGGSAIVSTTCTDVAGIGNHTGYIVISGNDPIHDLLVVPVRLTVSGVYLLNPEPGDTLSAGDSIVLDWSLDNPGDVISCTLNLSTDGGQTFGQTIIEDYSGSPPFLWTVPALTEDSCVVHISCETATAGTITDSSDGLFSILQGTLSSLDDWRVIIDRWFLAQNHPNPFNPMTTISFELPSSGPVSLKIFDVSGRLVDTLVDGEVLAAARHDIVWRGCDSVGRTVAAGVYFYRLEAGDFSDTRRMTLVK